MPTVTFASYCYHRDAERVHSPGFLKRLTEQHGFGFNQLILVKQNCRGLPCRIIDDVPNLQIAETEDHSSIYADYNIRFPNPEAEVFYDGSNEPHYWPKHTQNLLIAGKMATSEYILFSDSDITIERNAAPGWISTAIDCLNKYRDVLLVCPGEGSRGGRVAEGGYTDIMSQQIFLIKADRFRSINLDIPFPYTRQTVPSRYTPAMPQYHFMLEGRIGRFMIDNRLNRLVLDSNRWRYWHHNPCSVGMFDVKPTI